MRPFGDFAADDLIAVRPQLAPLRRHIVAAAAVYLVRFDALISADFVHDAFAALARRVADAVGWSAAESRRVALRAFHDASRRYFASSWDAVSGFVDANAPAVRDVRRRHAQRMDVITNGLGPNENAVRTVDDVTLDVLLARARRDAPLLLKVYADYCSVCAAMAPEFESAARALYPAVTFAALDGPRNLTTAREVLHCDRYPTVLKFLGPGEEPEPLRRRTFSHDSLVSFATVAGGRPHGAAGPAGADAASLSSPPAAVTPVDRALAISAETDPDPAGGLMGQWARMLRRQGIDQLEALVADRDVAMHSAADDALGACGDEEACGVWEAAPGDGPGVDPVAILLGGGMGSGKSGSMHSLSQTAFWKARGASVVVVEADAFKQADPMFTALNAIGVEASPVVHPKSLEGAEKLFLKAVEARRDVVLDGTLAWRPFAEQTFAMLRDVDHHYARGPGYRSEGGRVSEQYWVKGERRAAPARRYRVEIVGVTVEPAVAVERGIVRKLLIGRGVPVRQQLESHRQFSENFEGYLSTVDGGYLFDVSSVAAAGDEPEVGDRVSGSVAERAIIAAKRGVLFPRRAGAPGAGGEDGLVVENKAAYRQFLNKRFINVSASQASELYRPRPAAATVQSKC
jgi:thiol-disulfide isomerase/thioredoxin